MSDAWMFPNVPGLGGGAWFSTGTSGLQNAQNQYAQNQAYFGNQAAMRDQSQAMHQQLTGNLTQDPAKYAAIGAAYGRAVGPSAAPGTYSPGSGRSSFSGTPLGGSGAGPPMSVDVASSPFNVRNAGAVPFLGTGGGDPFGGGGFNSFNGRSSMMPAQAPVPHLSGGGMPFGGGGFGTPPTSTRNFDQAFDSNFSPANPTMGFSRRLSMPQMGYDAGASAALPPGPRQSRFDPQSAIDAVNQFEGVGTVPPTAPGRNVGGANPFTSRADALRFPNLGGLPPASPFDVGAPHIGRTMDPFMVATSGGGVGRQSAPSDYAPSSPFESGTSPFPFQRAGGQAFPGAGIGSYRGNMRDQIAAIMSGSQGMREPGAVDNGAVGTEIPLPQSRPPEAGPTPSQMGDAWSRIRAGPGSPGVSSVAQQIPAPYARINQAIYDIGNVSRPDMFDNLRQPLGSMFSPGQYRGASPPPPNPNSPPFNTKAGPITQDDIDQAWQLQGVGGRFLR